MFFLFSCSSENKIHESNLALLDEVIYEHDELMKDMKELKDLKTKLESLKESDGNIDMAIKNLDEARKGMMSFMKDFSEEFPFDSYPMQKDAFENLDTKKLKEINDKLKSQKEVVMEISSKFSSSIAQAENILD
tara:strand:+ start:291 stop:692 length:402 start_codon:yes stop_codon:yes gene_type:complete